MKKMLKMIGAIILCALMPFSFSACSNSSGGNNNSAILESGLDLNPMISGCMTKIFKNYDGDKLIDEIKQYLAENEL